MRGPAFFGSVCLRDMASALKCASEQTESCNQLQSKIEYLWAWRGVTDGLFWLWIIWGSSVVFSLLHICVSENASGEWPI